MFANESVSIKKIECRVLNSRKINVKITLEIEIKLYLNNNLDLINGINNIEDIQVLNDTKNISSLIGQGNTTVYAKDTINIDEADDLAEIMKVEVRIVDKDNKLSYNKVLAKADAQVSILYLTEDNRIKSITNKIPVMGFIDIENISDNNICDIDYKIKNLIVKPNNGENNSMYIEVQTEINCMAYETRQVDIIEDLYSIYSDLNITQKRVTTMANKQNIKDTYNIREQISIPEIGNNRLLNVQVMPIILNTSIKNGKVIYEAQVDLEILYETNNGVDLRTVQLPFNFEIMSNDIGQMSNINTSIEIRREDFIVDNGNINVNIELEFNVSVYQNENLNIIDDICEGEKRQDDNYSMVIYFVKPNDTLWKIAKKFKSTVEDIVRLNKIEDENKIYINQQLYIPKFVRKNIMV